MIIYDEVLHFLKGIPPFQFLDESSLEMVVANLSMDFYPKNSIILKQYGAPSDSLRIIKKGAVKVLMATDLGAEEVVIDFKGEGDTFGFLSLIGKDKQRTTVMAIDDTLCYVLSKDGVFKLLENSPTFNEFYMAYLSRYVDRTYQEMYNKSLTYVSADRVLFSTPVGQVAVPPITVPESATIQEAAQLMVRHKISSVILVNANGTPIGIVTDRDFREKVVAKGRSPLEPIKNISSLSLIRVDDQESCFEAMLKMIKFDIHHMLVIKDGALQGILTNHDLMLFQGTSPLSLVHDIINQQTVEGLIPLSHKINNIVGLLLKEEAKASSITKIISEINDRLLMKIIEITEKKLGPPPLPYCWVVYGSEGRKEQTFKTDQDNALIYNQPATPEEEEEAKKYFAVFCSMVTKNLVQVGFPPCPANYMASNPEWCQPVGTWKKYFTRWINEAVPEALLKVLIFFDLRPVYGKFSLADEIKNVLFSSMRGNQLFFSHMAGMILQTTPPLGFFKTFVVEKSGEHKDKFDLKVKGLTPLLDAVRLFCMEKEIKEYSTLERITTLRNKHSVVKDYAEEIEHAFEFVLLLRIHHQYEQIKEGRVPDNFINPDQLSNLEKKTIKEAFNLMSRIQGTIVERYKTLIR
jgi:CBS domain-containing protein